MTPLAEDASATLPVQNSPILWISVVGVFGVIFVQTFLYVRAAQRAADGIGMPRKDLRRGFRAGAVASIGSSLAVVLIAFALLALFGVPALLLRIGLIGSAGTETGSAAIAAETMGVELGGSGYTSEVFVVMLAAMTLSDGMWMVCTLILTPILKRGGKKFAQKNPAALAIVPSAALLGAFSILTAKEASRSGLHLGLVLVSAAIMAACLLAAERFKWEWIREWALGIAILLTLIFAFAAEAVILS